MATEQLLNAAAAHTAQVGQAIHRVLFVKHLAKYFTQFMYYTNCVTVNGVRCYGIGVSSVEWA